MKIIAIANQKGGVGKTTSAVYLAACAIQDRKITLILDADPQASAAEWIEEASTLDGWNSLDCVETPSARILSRAIAENHALPNDGLVIIDTPPGDPELAFLAIQNADAVVIPTRAGLLEVPRVALTLRLVPEGTPAGIIVTAANTQTRAFRETVDAWRASENLLGWVRARTALTTSFGLDTQGLLEYGPIYHAIKELCYRSDVI